ncbi:FecR family protein [Pedobacter sp. MC2016-24]|uniref:FecR family protein n=1 Tax=Pedobacter sp. MC2016-24 TaxID=2780090 RepID=UPI00187F950E|nr:FecR family protein [Pedobacter sp. MC2016-24]MBE9598462.1 FecR domain-containing protein [Pedobacter sp. MC2016-24]
MEQQEINGLIEKYKEGIASPQEIDALQNWYRSVGYADGIYPDHEITVKTRIQDRLIATIHPVKPNKLWPRIAITAAAVAALIFGVWLFEAHYRNGRHPELVSGPQYSNDVAPGKNTATLTLANGKTITLSDAKTGVVIQTSKLTYTDGTAVSGQHRPSRSDAEGSGAKNQLLTAQTPLGGTYQFTLPDGTRVWLNADSKISFPMQFSGKSRKILLSGEAYFEVQHLALATPFIVETPGQQVTVLGTHFNINAYKDEADTKTTLLQGSVKVSQGSAFSILSPGQQAILSAQNISLKAVNVNDVIDWKNGEFIFKNEPLPNILRRVARWYNVTVTYQAKYDQIPTYSGSVSRLNNVSEVLHMLEKTGDSRFEIRGNQIIVKPK